MDAGSGFAGTTAASAANVCDDASAAEVVSNATVPALPHELLASAAWLTRWHSACSARATQPFTVELFSERRPASSSARGRRRSMVLLQMRWEEGAIYAWMTYVAHAPCGALRPACTKLLLPHALAQHVSQADSSSHDFLPLRKTLQCAGSVGGYGFPR